MVLALSHGPHLYFFDDLVIDSFGRLKGRRLLLLDIKLNINGRLVGLGLMVSIYNMPGFSKHRLNIVMNFIKHNVQ